MPYQQTLNTVRYAENETINIRVWPLILDDAVDELPAVSAETTQVKILGLADCKSRQVALNPSESLIGVPRAGKGCGNQMLAPVLNQSGCETFQCNLVHSAVFGRVTA
ncbi:MAG: hypothetical protein AUI36_43560 [Cyanobacteria bacterium 13_1_40CM_2_61_4]|nr:MAG: hypothetical protein AUI36_43560 [Cyanobacteria bacterium 13_1_40CM_2_61_4]